MKMGGGFKWFMTMGAESGISGVENPHYNKRQLFISTVSRCVTLRRNFRLFFHEYITKQQHLNCIPYQGTKCSENAKLYSHSNWQFVFRKKRKSPLHVKCGKVIS